MTHAGWESRVAAAWATFDERTDEENRALIEALAPAALVFSKLDVWPVLAAHARTRAVRLGLVSATLPAGSSRRGRLAGALPPGSAILAG